MCQLSPAQEEDTAIVSDTTDDLWFLTEGESEQVSVEMKEAALEEWSGGEGETPPEDDDGGGKEEKADREVRKIISLFSVRIHKMFNQMSCMFIQMQEEPDEDSQCLSDDTDTEISTQVYIFRYVFSHCVL